ncbi:hypothetical protein SAMD00024442_24_28 [Candidatus Symbiothrix dinenymphae]|nr:hypothetical protein SAMD00024442_24_28 [Candidatus Symbiothrix dinenymphae]
MNANHIQSNPIKVLLGVFAVWFCCISTFAQPPKHEFSVYAGIAPAHLFYSPVVGEDKTGIRAMGGFGYTRFLSITTGLNTGVEMGYYNSTLAFNNLSATYPTTDTDGAPYEFRMKTNDYKEKQNSYFLQIPLMFQYQTAHEILQFYAAGGAKLAIHLQTKYQTNPSLMQNSGYYADEDYEYTSQTFLDFGTLAEDGKTGTLDVSTGILGSVETGVRWPQAYDFSLYVGVYADYGFNLNTNSILFSGYHQPNLSTMFEGKLIPLTVGVKIKFAMGNKSLRKMRDPCSCD